MDARIGMKISFEYCGEKYEREIEEITIYKNYSWIGDLGFADNVAFCVHGDLDYGKRPLMEGLVIQFDDMENIAIHGYIRTGITFKP